MRAALPLSAASHAAIIGLLLFLPAVMPPPPKIDLSNAVEVIFAPAPAPPAAARPPVPLVAEQPSPPALVQPPAPPVAQTEPPPVPKPAPKPRPKPIDRPPAEMTLPLPTAPVPTAPPQVASLPPPGQAAVISADYRAALSRWLESHKRYPDEARQRGEQGSAVLRFRVDRNGRVLDYTVASSTGYRDLDASIEAMMRGSTLPPFPASMTSPEIEVSVELRFGMKK